MINRENLQFKAKEQIDQWYERAIEGISRAMISEEKISNHEIISNVYHARLTSLNTIREGAYSCLNIDKKPKHLDINTLVEKIRMVRP